MDNPYHNKRLCDQAQDLDNYIETYKSFSSKTKAKEVKAFGCLKDTCRRAYWERLWSDDLHEDEKLKGLSKVQLNFQGDVPTIMSTHSFAYRLSNFIADFGGYLGLLLGGSLLSFFDFTWDSTINFIESWKKRQQT